MRQSTLAYRFWEILPATLTFGSFLGITILSILAPQVIASLLLVYVFYWFMKSLLMSFHLLIGYRSYRQAIRVHWLNRLQSTAVTALAWQNIWHVIIIANGTEELAIVRSTLEALAKSHYPLDRLIVVLANEERFAEIARSNQAAVKKEFGTIFAHLWLTTHPADIPGEVRGKGANISYAAHTILPRLEKMKLAPDNVLVTTLDGDHRVHPHYLAALTWSYLHEPDRELKSYQPLPMFFNNIWSVPFVIRSISVGSSFWQMIEATRPYRLRNFAAQTQSLAILLKTDFWSSQTIVEDGHQYWRSFFATGGHHEVVPIFIPIYQDAVLSPRGYVMTYREQYLQKRRWAWGVSDIPFVMTELIRRRKTIPLIGWVQAIRLLEGHYSWAATSLILAIFGWLPSLLSPDFRETALAFNFVYLFHRFLTIAMIGMVISLIISRLLLPPRPRHRIHQNDILEWLLTPLLLPLANILFGSIPAIDAQVRLAFGNYLGFRITEKAPVRQALPVIEPNT